MNLPSFAMPAFPHFSHVSMIYTFYHGSNSEPVYTSLERRATEADKAESMLEAIGALQSKALHDGCVTYEIGLRVRKHRTDYFVKIGGMPSSETDFEDAVRDFIFTAGVPYKVAASSDLGLLSKTFSLVDHRIREGTGLQGLLERLSGFRKVEEMP